MSLLGSLAVAGGTALINGISNFIQNKREREQQLEDRSYDLRQFLENREYNTPVNQRKRLEAAGISPINGGIDSGNSSTAFNGGNIAPEADALSNIMTGAQKGLQMYLNRRDIDISQRAKAIDQQIQSRKLDIQEKYFNDLIEKGYAGQQVQKEIAESRNEVTKRGQDINKTLGEARNDLTREGLQFKKEYYTNPLYLGYQQVQLAKQLYDFNSKIESYKTNLLSHMADIKAAEAKYADDFNWAKTHNLYWDQKNKSEAWETRMKYNIFDAPIKTQLLRESLEKAKFENDVKGLKFVGEIFKDLFKFGTIGIKKL